MATIEDYKIAYIALIKMGDAPHYVGSLDERATMMAVVKEHEERAARTEMRISFLTVQKLSKQDL